MNKCNSRNHVVYLKILRVCFIFSYSCVRVVCLLLCLFVLFVCLFVLFVGLLVGCKSSYMFLFTVIHIRWRSIENNFR